MAEKKTVDKVKELLEMNAYAPLKEAAEKWLAAADEKYGDKFDELKEKAAPAVDEIKESVGELKESVEEIKAKATPAYEELKEKAAPAVAELKEKAAPAVAELKGKAQPTLDKISDSEFVAKLKESVATLSETIDFFGSKEGEDLLGKEAAEQIRKHAEEMKALGKTFCDCPACTKAREILRDLGEDIGE